MRSARKGPSRSEELAKRMSSEPIPSPGLVGNPSSAVLLQPPVMRYVVIYSSAYSTNLDAFSSKMHKLTCFYFFLFSDN